MRTTASAEYRAQIEKLVGGMYDEIVATIGANRPNMEEGAVKGAIDAGLLSGRKAKEMGLVEQTFTRDKVGHWLDSQFPAGAVVDENYGQPKKKSIDMDSPFALFSLLGDQPKAKARGPEIAVIYAVGEIVPDFVGGEDSTENVTPAGIRAAVETGGWRMTR